MIGLVGGVAMILAVFAILFFLMASITGWRVVAIIWGVSLLVTVVLIYAAWLIAEAVA